jgi:hypothetical protein
MLDENGVKAMPGLISAPNSGSSYKINIGSQMGHTKVMLGTRSFLVSHEVNGKTTKNLVSGMT